MNGPDWLGPGRAAADRLAWREVYDNLSAADRQAPLGVDELERLATTAYLIGRDGESLALWSRAHQECLRLDDPARAARCAFWLALGLLLRGEVARASGWLARARRLLDGRAPCAEQGYLLVPVGLQRIAEGDAAGAFAAFQRVVEFGDQFRDSDLLTLGRLGGGQALIRLGQDAAGVALLDEAMVAVTADEVSPVVSGITYCAVIEACQELFDLRRAQEWTAALSDWCAAQPDLVAFRGQCRVHRTELLLVFGAWSEAAAEAERACQELAGHPAAGLAFYHQAELYRLRGEFARAEAVYRQASRAGHVPQPGLALLRLAEGRIEAAAAAMRSAGDGGQGRGALAKLLAARVEIMLAAGDLASARLATEALERVTSGLPTLYPKALSDQAEGAVLLASGQASTAIGVLRRAWTTWQELGAPYEAARTRVLLALAHSQLGDRDGAELERDAALGVFRQLGAVHDLVRLEALQRGESTPLAHGLSARELEVLGLLATGKSNRAIGADLVISEKTVARHVSNIFTKLGVRSRAAATAQAYEHGLV